jgi:chorismate synthase
MGSSFGQLFRITTFGESHGGGVGVVIDGCPPRISLGEADIQRELDRRRPGQSAIVSSRQEADRCEILSGVFEGATLGTPIAILVRNEDARPEDYRAIKEHFALRMPTLPTRPNTEFGTGREAAAPLPGRQSVASPPAPWLAKSLPLSTRARDRNIRDSRI